MIALRAHPVFRGAMNEVILVISTFPDVAVARQIGTLLVEKQLAACVNLLPGAESIYRWQGKIETTSEVLAIIKTTGQVFPELESELQRLHPYEVPEIVAIEPEAVAGSYLAWVLENVQ